MALRRPLPPSGELDDDLNVADSGGGRLGRFSQVRGELGKRTSQCARTSFDHLHLHRTRLGRAVRQGSRQLSCNLMKQTVSLDSSWTSAARGETAASGGRPVERWRSCPLNFTSGVGVHCDPLVANIRADGITVLEPSHDDEYYTGHRDPAILRTIGLRIVVITSTRHLSSTRHSCIYAVTASPALDNPASHPSSAAPRNPRIWRPQIPPPGTSEHVDPPMIRPRGPVARTCLSAGLVSAGISMAQGRFPPSQQAALQPNALHVDCCIWPLMRVVFSAQQVTRPRCSNEFSL